MITDTIVAPATAEGKAGLSIIRVSGSKSHKICRKLTKNKVSFIDRGPVLSPVFLGESIIDMYVRPNKSSIQRPMASHLQEEAAVNSPIVKQWCCQREGLNQRRMAGT